MALPEGLKLLQARIPTELLDQLDTLCQQAGRISRADALIVGWPDLMDALREIYRIGEAP